MQYLWTCRRVRAPSPDTLFGHTLTSALGATASSRDDIETVMSELPEPIDLEVDDENDVLYWTDRGELPMGNTLNRKHLGDQAPAEKKALGRQILAQGFGEAIGLRYDKGNDAIFVADMVSLSVIMLIYCRCASLISTFIFRLAGSGNVILGCPV